MCLVVAAFLVAAARGFADADDVPVTFSLTTNTAFGTSVFVAGNIPQLYNWDPTRAIELTPGNCNGSNCTWSATIGIPPGTSYQYKFILRNDCATCLSDPTNVQWPPGANQTGATAPGPPAPYSGKTIFYYSSWSNVSLYYSNSVTGWTNAPMIAIGPGRTGGEQIWRASNVDIAGDTNLEFGFYSVVAGTNVYDNAGLPDVDYQSPLDALVVQDGQVYNYWPPPSVSASAIDTLSITPTDGLDTRPVRVYKPRGYAENTGKSYPVLYMHDGQNVFLYNAGGSSPFRWGAETNADNLIRFGKMRETIIVGVDCNTDSNTRVCEYSPPQPVCTNLCAAPLGSQYVSFLIDQVKPLIDANYRTLTNADDTGVMGSSMGGLISTYLGWQYTNVFHKVGAMSSAFCDYYPMSAADVQRPQLRIYMDSGDNDTSNVATGVGCLVNDDLLNTIGERDALIGLGYVFNNNLDHTVGYGQWHNEQWWCNRLPRCYTFLFPTSDEPDTVLDAAAPPRITNFQLLGPSNVVTWTAYKARLYALQGSTNQSYSSTMNWSNVFTTPAPEPLPWDYVTGSATNTFQFFRVLEYGVPNWPN